MSRDGILGGTFDVLHDGHHALISTAFSYGGHVTVGLTADKFAGNSRKREVSSFDERKESLQNACHTYSNIHNTSFEINKIEDAFSPAVHTDADFIVISPEEKTQERVIEINKRREENDNKRLQVIEAPMVRDYQGRRISATRISNGEIDEHGRQIE